MFLFSPISLETVSRDRREKGKIKITARLRALIYFTCIGYLLTALAQTHILRKLLPTGYKTQYHPVHLTVFIDCLRKLFSLTVCTDRT